MAIKQGFQDKPDPFVYQELASGVSVAYGIDDSDDDKIKINTSTSAGVTPSSGNNNISIDPAANGNIVITPNGTGIVDTGSAEIHTTGGISFDTGTNVLDFYENGTWTPELRFGGGTTGITYSTQGGHYIRIGTLVLALFNLNLTNKGSSTGVATIANLPFSANTEFYNTTPVLRSVGVPGRYITVYTVIGSSSCRLRNILNNSDFTSVDNTQFNNDSVISGTIVYKTS